MLAFIDLIAGRPWAIRPDIALHVHGLLAKEGLAGLRHLAELKHDIHMTDAAQAARGSSRTRQTSTVAVIPIIGTLTHRPEIVGSAVTRSTAEIAMEAQTAAADPAVDSIVLEVASPGGEVQGTPEAFEAIREAGMSKPIVAAVNASAASAGYYLAAAAEEIFLTPSGVVGSVGVFALHIDRSKAIEDSGEAWEFVVAEDSPFKVEGNPNGPLTDEARRDFQGHIDRYMALFIRDLARGRAVGRDQVREHFGGGRMLGPKAAIDAGMIDQVGTIDAAVARAARLGREWRDKRESAAARAAADEAPVAPKAEETPTLPPAAQEELEAPETKPEAPDPGLAADIRRRLRDSA